MRLRYYLKYLLAPILYRVPVSGLQPERLYVYMDEVWKRRDKAGTLLEVGCNLGGTAALVFKMLERTGFTKEYTCIVTFEGFDETQFERDREIGTPESKKKVYSQNSLKLVRRLLDSYGCGAVELIQGDVTRVDESVIPDNILVCLHDVDLEIPTYEGLKKVYGKVIKGGVILVDDCPEDYIWAGARLGYRKFVEEYGLPERYRNGVGIIEK